MASIAKTFVILPLAVAVVVGAFNEDPCASLGGMCQDQNGQQCVGGRYQSGKCPTQAADIRCCVPDVEPACSALSGSCRFTSTGCSSGGGFISGKCPDQPFNVKCCTGAAASTGCSGSCDAASRSLSCEIVALERQGKIWLKDFNDDARGRNDGANARDNIHDMCQGRKAKRSSYGNAPGGCVCLQSNMLRTMRDYANQFYSTHGQPIKVTSIAGGSHSRNSKHYSGTSMDVRCFDPLTHCNQLVSFCRARGAVELCYPGSSCSGHATWVHCAL